MKRVIYNKSPLIEVIIQFRFPKILSLNSEDPIQFQEAIRTEYPNYQLTLENQQDITVPLTNNTPAIPPLIQRTSIKNHNFISSDGLYKINLTSSFISISTVKYTKWEDILSHFEKPLSEFERIYSPQFYERIGLRYIDAYSRIKINLKDTPYKELIKQPWIGALAVIDENKIVNSTIQTEYYLDSNKSRAIIKAGTGTINKDSEKVFIIDSDFICKDTISIDNSLEILSTLHKHAKQFISKAITKKLNDAMEPKVVK